MNVVDGLLMVQAPADFDDAAFTALRQGVLDKVHGNSIRGVIIDMAAIQMIDSVGFGLLADTARTVAMLGARTVFVGFQPGVVSALIDLGVACEDIVAARELADAMALLRPLPRQRQDADPDEDVDAADKEAADDDGDALLSEDAPGGLDACGQEMEDAAPQEADASQNDHEQD
ncbi:MAG: STAS domain-containing protein [Desulfovibrionaceae bacterium]